MRSLLLVTLALAAAVAAPAPAHACGGNYLWMPTGHMVVTAGLHHRASFALLWNRLDTAQEKNVELERLDEVSYDDTRIAVGPQLAAKLPLTLVGPAGTKVVQATSTLWVDVPYDTEGAREAVTVPEGYAIALDGDLKDASWEAFRVVYGYGITEYKSAHVQAVVEQTTRKISVNGMTLEGLPLGVVTVRNVRYLAIADKATSAVSFVRV